MLQLQFVNFKAGSYMVVEGKGNVDMFYIIQKGLVVCNRIGDPNSSRLGPGDFVAVVSCFANRPQIENAICATDVTAIAVRKDQYPELIAANTPVALKIIKAFANRMRKMNEMLTKATLNNVVAENPIQVFNVAQYYEKAGKMNIASYAYYQFLKTRPVGAEAEVAKRRFIALRQTTKPAFLEPTADQAREYPADTMIFSESQGGAEMYIIQTGKVEISKVVDGNEVVLAVLKQGDMFGEMALLENKPRSASAIARENCRLLVVNRANFNQMVTTQPQLIARLTTTLAERLWSMSRQLDNASLRVPMQKMLDMLCLQLEKQKLSILNGKNPMLTEFSPQDIANMCGIPHDQQPKAIYDFQQLTMLAIQNNKIFIKDCTEVFKQAAFYKKQAQEMGNR